MQKSILIFLLSALMQLKAQKYNFVNWTVEDGLIQSQALFICQDKYRHLWIGTEGGLSRFDGKKFTGYTVREGLITNHINHILCDAQGNIWAGTSSGISVYNGRTFKTIKLPSTSSHHISALAQSADGAIVALDIYNGLYSIRNEKIEKLGVSGDTLERITSLTAAPSGQLLAFVYGKGLYAQTHNVWSLLVPASEVNPKFIRKVYITSQGDTLLSFNSGLYQVKNRKIVLYRIGDTTLTDITVLCIAEDEKKRIWIGTENGVFKIDGSQLIHFDAKRGFTDNSVYHIHRDVENNLWFATDADGIFKFRENTFTYYDKSSGLSNTIIMGVVQTTNGKIYAAGYGGGLYTINEHHDIEPVKLSNNILTDAKINCLYADRGNNIFIGTLGKGVWQYNTEGVLKKLEATNKDEINLRGANCFYSDRRGNLVIGNAMGIFIKSPDGHISRIRIPGGTVTTLRPLKGDSILVGTSRGIYILDQEYQLQSYFEKELGNASVLCIARTSSNIWVGTTDKGVLNINTKTGRLVNYNTSNGLPSNFIYSIDVTEKQKAWIGTGFGISNLQVNKSGEVLAIKNYGRSEGLLGMECSHNCLLRASDSSLWFGTTKGLFHFNPSTEIEEKNKPLVLIKSVKLFSSDITDTTLYSSLGPWFNVPSGLKLGSKQNHLTFELGSIYFTNPEDLLYRYKLDGVDKQYTTSNNPLIIYPALPPGNYTLLISGVTKSGVLSENQIRYTFAIEKAFYQTRYFQVFVIVLLLATGALITYILTRGRQKRKQKAKELLAKIREEEFLKLRQRTAEDFHDEMGNSLTRISVLTDVLKSKINGKESEVTRLVQQIKENTTALYNGSRDIIWSLNSQNDGIYEITEHVKEIGLEIFNDTPVEFIFNHNIRPFSPLKLKLDYSRNLTMIFKEGYSNILKHSAALKVEVDLQLKNNNELHITITDNGTGFDMNASKHGNGIRNMNNRVQRMHGSLTVNTAINKGTEIGIVLNNIFIN